MVDKLVTAVGGLEDRPVEEALRPRADELVGDGVAAARYAEDRHAVPVAAEAGDVVPHPLERARLIAHAEVCAFQLRVGKVAEQAEAVLDLDEDDACATTRWSPCCGFTMRF